MGRTLNDSALKFLILSVFKKKGGSDVILELETPIIQKHGIGNLHLRKNKHFFNNISNLFTQVGSQDI